MTKIPRKAQNRSALHDGGQSPNRLIPTIGLHGRTIIIGIHGRCVDILMVAAVSVRQANLNSVGLATDERKRADL